MINIDTLVVGALGTNCYIVGDDAADAVVAVDPGGEAERILSHIEQTGKRLEAILITHGHVDHVAAAARVSTETGAPIHAHPADGFMMERPDPMWAQMVGGVPPCSVDVELADGDVLKLAGLSLTVIGTPGHSPGGVCLLTGDTLFSGDTLFEGSIGRTDLPGSDTAQMAGSLGRLMNDLADNVDVYPGHGEGTTIGEERRSNPFLQGM